MTDSVPPEVSTTSIGSQSTTAAIASRDADALRALLAEGRAVKEEVDGK